MKVRLKFTKTGVMKFVGHLDFLRMFQKAFRRANIPMAYSQGFNPHQLISIGAPLAIGITSSGEYMDIQIQGSIDKASAIDQLNATLPNDVKIIDWIELDEHTKASMALIEAADYQVSLSEWKCTDYLKEKIQDFLNQKEILIMKKTKKTIKEVNIKDGILKLEYDEQNNTLKMMLATGSKLNIKPELVIKALCQFIDKPYAPFDYTVHRNELYVIKNNAFMPLDALS